MAQRRSHRSRKNRADTSSNRATGDASTLKALERRRLRAARMFDRGATAAEVARALGVTPQSAGRWRKRFELAVAMATWWRMRNTGRSAASAYSAAKSISVS